MGAIGIYGDVVAEAIGAYWEFGRMSRVVNLESKVPRKGSADQR